MNYEWIGILGSIFIIIAFTNKKEKVIRIFDAVGACLFIIYGGLTHTWSTMVLNAILVIVHIIRFIGMRRSKNGERTESLKGR